MAYFNELPKDARNNPIFQRYLQLLGTDPFIQQIEESSLDQALMLDVCRGRLHRMAFAFNIESPHMLVKAHTTISAFEWAFRNLIHIIVSNPDLPDAVFNGELGKVNKHLRAAKQSLANAQSALNRTSSRSNLDAYNHLNDCTIFFENALGHWKPKETYKNVLLRIPERREMTISECRYELAQMHRYFAKNSYLDMKDGFIRLEASLRQNIILCVLDADVFQKEGILPHLRTAKIYLNLALDEIDPLKQPKQSQRRSDERLIDYFTRCEGCLYLALTQWKDP